MGFADWWNNLWKSPAQKGQTSNVKSRFSTGSSSSSGRRGGGGSFGPAPAKSSGGVARAPSGSNPKSSSTLSAGEWSAPAGNPGGYVDSGGWGGNGGGGGGGGGISSAQAKVNKEGKDRANRENAATKANVDHQLALLAGFAKSRDTKLGSIQTALTSSDKILLDGYGRTLGSLRGNILDNDKAQGDNTYSNVANAIRERQDISNEVASQGGGETDVLRAQLSALRNYTSNQGETNRAFHDTLRSANNSITSLNTETGTSRNNLYNQAEADREAAHANYNNQMSDTWTQISNIENANTNVDSDSSAAYKKTQPNAAKEAAKFVGSAYKRRIAPSDWSKWAGKGDTEDRTLTSSNRAAAVNLGGPLQRPEGATLRKW